MAVTPCRDCRLRLISLDDIVATVAAHAPVAAVSSSDTAHSSASRSWPWSARRRKRRRRRGCLPLPLPAPAPPHTRLRSFSDNDRGDALGQAGDGEQPSEYVPSRGPPRRRRSDALVAPPLLLAGRGWPLLRARVRLRSPTLLVGFSHPLSKKTRCRLLAGRSAHNMLWDTGAADIRRRYAGSLRSLSPLMKSEDSGRQVVSRKRDLMVTTSPPISSEIGTSAWSMRHFYPALITETETQPRIPQSLPDIMVPSLRFRGGGSGRGPSSYSAPNSRGTSSSCSCCNVCLDSSTPAMNGCGCNRAPVTSSCAQPNVQGGQFMLCACGSKQPPQPPPPQLPPPLLLPPTPPPCPPYPGYLDDYPDDSCLAPPEPYPEDCSDNRSYHRSYSDPNDMSCRESGRSQHPSTRYSRNEDYYYRDRPSRSHGCDDDSLRSIRHSPEGSYGSRRSTVHYDDEDSYCGSRRGVRRDVYADDDASSCRSRHDDYGDGPPIRMGQTDECLTCCGSRSEREIRRRPSNDRSSCSSGHSSRGNPCTITRKCHVDGVCPEIAGTSRCFSDSQRATAHGDGQCTRSRASSSSNDSFRRHTSSCHGSKRRHQECGGQGSTCSPCCKEGCSACIRRKIRGIPYRVQRVCPRGLNRFCS